MIHQNVKQTNHSRSSARPESPFSTNITMPEPKTTITPEVVKETIPEQQPSVALMLQSALEKGITPENATALEKLMDLYERMEDKRAIREFNAAMVALKQEMPTIQVSKAVPNNDGTIRYRYAPLEDIDGKLRPHALKHGFTYSFSEAPSEPNKVTKVCVVTHIGGHSQSTPFTVRIGKGPPGSSEAQGDGAAASYAQRRALCDAFGIIVESDTDGSDDPHNEGRPITAKEAADLRDWVEKIGADEKAFLAFAGAAHYEAIMSSRLDSLTEMLRRKEKAMQSGR